MLGRCYPLKKRQGNSIPPLTNSPHFHFILYPEHIVTDNKVQVFMVETVTLIKMIAHKVCLLSTPLATVGVNIIPSL